MSWPALMDEATACDYLKVGPLALKGLTARYKVAPVDMGSRLLRWRRADLDRLVDNLPVRGQFPISETPTFADSDMEALRRVERRNRKRES